VPYRSAFYLLVPGYRKVRLRFTAHLSTALAARPPPCYRQHLPSCVDGLRFFSTAAHSPLPRQQRRTARLHCQLAQYHFWPAAPSAPMTTEQSPTCNRCGDVCVRRDVLAQTDHPAADGPSPRIALQPSLPGWTTATPATLRRRKEQEREETCCLPASILFYLCQTCCKRNAVNDIWFSSNLPGPVNRLCRTTHPRPVDWTPSVL